ncbi:MAG: DNA mismatch repair endonuclease MutL [Chloroflexi bacterium]|nr:DNA mismatch repair endonuclease MutL [Chloroflexota bacterium]
MREGVLPLRVLPPEVARLIAAGEVVTRPADVVKELVENAIDAVIERQAHDRSAEPPAIRVEIRSGGLALIRVVDNGSGIAADDVELAFQRHATSKVATAADLDAIHTLGFRGEALASIGAVAQVQILTRPPEASAGVSVTVEQGQVTSRRQQGCGAGTTVAVRNIFANVPARRKFLRGQTSEATQISQLVTHYALAYPEIRFVLVNDDRATLQTSGRGDLAETVVDVLGVKVAEQLLPVADADAAVAVSGYVGTPELIRPTRSGLTFFVNRRIIRSPMLGHAVTDAYPAAMLAGRFPVAILNVSIPAELVDVNVHPTKAEVRFASDHAVYQLVHRAVRMTLGDRAPLPELALTPPEAWSDTPLPAGPDQERRPAVRSTTTDPGAVAAAQTLAFFAPSASNGAAGDATAATGARERQRDGAAEARPEPTAIRLSALRPVGQVQGTYVVAEDDAGVYFVDQHAAHEAILYQQMRETRQCAPPAICASQELLQPQAIDLTPRQAQSLAGQGEQLASLGFGVEPFGERSGLLRRVPSGIRHRDYVRTLLEILDLLAAQAEDPSATSAFDQASARLACHSAVRDGDTLSLDEMRELLAQVERQPNLWSYCPHGRPIFLRLSSAQLARDFRRR